jgi:hypothetical protein
MPHEQYRASSSKQYVQAFSRPVAPAGHQQASSSSSQPSAGKQVAAVDHQQGNQVAAAGHGLAHRQQQAKTHSVTRRHEGTTKGGRHQSTAIPAAARSTQGHSKPSNGQGKPNDGQGNSSGGG